MGTTAVGLALLTVLVGTLILADVSGPRAAAPPRAVLTAHVVLALLALVVVVLGAATANIAISSLALVLLVATGGFGITALRRTLARARDEGLKAPSTGVLVVHGAVAAATVLVAALAVFSLV